MVCVYCSGNTKVINSRWQKHGNSVWRRRRCVACGSTSTTLEKLAYDGALMVQSGTSHIVPFNRDQLFLSIYEVCRHRPQPVSDATALTDTVLGKLLKKSMAGALMRRDVVAVVGTALARFDHAAAVQYLAYHPL